MNLKSTFHRKLFEAKLINSDFFDGFSIKDKSLKKKILQWIFHLKRYRKIYIPNFSYLFSKFDDIVFPLKIYGYSGALWIEDSLCRHFYFSYLPFDFHKINEFSIGTKSQYFDTEFVYHLSDKGEVVLCEKLILQLIIYNNEIYKIVIINLATCGKQSS